METVIYVQDAFVQRSSQLPGEPRHIEISKLTGNTLRRFAGLTVESTATMHFEARRGRSDSFVVGDEALR